MRTIWERICRDLEGKLRPALIIGIYILIMNGLLHISVCPFRGIFGLPCPACGMTRAGLLFLKGDFRGAFSMHPFFYGVLALAAAAFVFRYLLDREIGWMQSLVILLCLGLLAYYVYRMKVCFPDIEPMTIEMDSLLGRLGFWDGYT